MDWATIVALILSQGIPVAERICQLWSKNILPTQEDWDTLKLLGKATARTRMMEALVRNNIDPASSQGQALLALTPP